MMNNIEKYIVDGDVRRSQIALDVADGTIAASEIRTICSDQRIKKAFIGTSYNKKIPKEAWNTSYLDQVVCASVAESFNLDYLLYLAEVGEYIRNRKTKSNKRQAAGIVAALAIVVAIAGIIIWKISR